MSEAEAEEMEEGGDGVDKDQLESLLNSDLLKINDLRDIIEDRDLNVTGRSNEKLISAILSDKWTTLMCSTLLISESDSNGVFQRISSCGIAHAVAETL